MFLRMTDWTVIVRWLVGWLVVCVCARKRAVYLKKNVNLITRNRISTLVLKGI
jgi:hypothetical protein